MLNISNDDGVTLLLDVMGHKDTIGSFRTYCIVSPFAVSETLIYPKCVLLNVLM